MGKPGYDAVVFDLGGVLIDWDPRYLYRQLFDDKREMERFLAEVCSPTWNLEQDRGRPIAEATALLRDAHPHHAEHIDAYYGRWTEMLAGPIEGTVAILRELCERQVRLLALTNWSAETFPYAEERFDFLSLFEGIVVSGREGFVKPDPALFALLVARHGLEPARTVFVDDSARNVEGARKAGFDGVVFSSPEAFRLELQARGLLPRG